MPGLNGSKLGLGAFHLSHPPPAKAVPACSVASAWLKLSLPRSQQEISISQASSFG